MSSRNVNGLTEKQQTFCDLYRASEDPDIRGNAKRCYMIAYSATEKSAESNGPRLVNKDEHVIEYLNNKTAQVMSKFDVTEERILQEIACSAFTDPKDFYDEEGALLGINEMPEHARRALAGIEVDSLFSGSGKNRARIGTTTKIKHIDKKASLELLMKNKGMLTDKVEHSGNIGGVLQVPNDVDKDEWLRKNYPQLVQSPS